MSPTPSLRPGFLHNLGPADLIAVSRGKPLSVFLTLHGDGPWLLVDLRDGGDELEAGLDGRQAQGDSDKDAGLGFHTQLRNRPNVGSRVIDEQPVHNLSELERRLGQARHRAVHIEKRVHDSAYRERISIGRARNKDIVLRHGMVSKFHAWFELSADGTLHVADAGSKNGTQLGSRLLPARELVPVSPGDVLRFGGVDAVVCAAQTLWQLISRAG